MDQMKILMVSSEYARIAMTGGLGTAVTGLARALQNAGHEVRVIIPYYRAHRDEKQLYSKFLQAKRDNEEALQDIVEDKGIKVYLAPVPCSLMSATYSSPQIRDSAYRLEDQRTFEGSRAFSLAVPQFLEGMMSNDRWTPDIVHLHEWQIASASQALKQNPRTLRIPVLVTTHNARYTGPVPQFHIPTEGFGRTFLDSPVYKGHMMTLSVNGDIFTSLLEMGAYFADGVNTVSPTYAQEILARADYVDPRAATAQEILSVADHVDPRIAKRLKEKGLVGILNGIDTQTFSPQNNEYIHAFNPADLESVAYGKGSNKIRMHQQFGIVPKGDVMQISFMSRLVEQKGIDVIMKAVKEINGIPGIQLLIVGETYNGNLRRDIENLNGSVRGRPYFATPDEQHLVLAGSDAILLPSRYEPCGLVPLEGMAMGAVPITTHVGGLKDTVKDFDGESGNGIVMRELSQHALVKTVKRAKALYDSKEAWRRIVGNALKEDFSWNGPRNSVEKYESLYRKLMPQGQPS